MWVTQETIDTMRKIVKLAIEDGLMFKDIAEDLGIKDETDLVMIRDAAITPFAEWGIEPPKDWDGDWDGCIVDANKRLDEADEGQYEATQRAVRLEAKLDIAERDLRREKAFTRSLLVVNATQEKGLVDALAIADGLRGRMHELERELQVAGGMFNAQAEAKQFWYDEHRAVKERLQSLIETEDAEFARQRELDKAE